MKTITAITILIITGRKRFGSIRFGSIFFSKINRLGSFGSEIMFSRFDEVRLAFFGHAVARSGSVRVGSASGSGRFRN